MIETKFEEKDQWMAGRLGKVSGTRLKDIAVASAVNKAAIVEALETKGVEFKKSATIPVLTELLSPEEIQDLTIKSMMAADKKKGYYEIIAERLAVQPDGENPMERGNRLEAESIARFEKESGKKVSQDLVILSREDNESIAISPDGFIAPAGKSKKIKEMVESKSLNSAAHIEAYLTQKVPSEYHHQVLQYFIVNDDCEKLHFLFYDPRFNKKLEFFSLTVERKDVQAEVTMYLKYQEELLKEVDEIVLSLI
jgi:guanylate kinase